MKGKALTPEWPDYPSDLEQKLKAGENKLALYNKLIPLMEYELELKRELEALTR